MNEPRHRSMPHSVRRTAACVVGAVLVVALAGACSSGGGDEGAASAPAASVAAANPDMLALCDQMVADGLTPEEATALAEENGFIARVGTIDGQPQAVTMDYREDRFTFDVADGAVIGCTYG